MSDFLEKWNASASEVAYAQSARLIALHDLAKVRPQGNIYEREIALRLVREAQRERAEWAKSRCGWQPMPIA